MHEQEYAASYVTRAELDGSSLNVQSYNNLMTALMSKDSLGKMSPVINKAASTVKSNDNEAMSRSRGGPGVKLAKPYEEYLKTSRNQVRGGYQTITQSKT